MELVIPYTVTEQEVQFFLYTREQQEVEVTKETINLITATDRNFHFLTHGHHGSHHDDWYQPLTNAYLAREDCNVIQIDWAQPANQYHYIGANNTRGVGRIFTILFFLVSNTYVSGVFVANFIVKLVQDLNVPLENIHIIGASFGAQVACFTGKEVFKQLNNRVGRITTLDPARRPIENSISELVGESLQYDDADVVLNLHGDGGFRGFIKPVGTIDFYPNGGTPPQPGCESTYRDMSDPMRK